SIYLDFELVEPVFDRIERVGVRRVTDQVVALIVQNTSNAAGDVVVVKHGESARFSRQVRQSRLRFKQLVAALRHLLIKRCRTGIDDVVLGGQSERLQPTGIDRIKDHRRAIGSVDQLLKKVIDSSAAAGTIFVALEQAKSFREQDDRF